MSNPIPSKSTADVQPAPTAVPHGFHASPGRKGFLAAVEQVTAALRAEGFGILTDIDVKAAMKAKLDIDLPAHRGNHVPRVRATQGPA